MTVTFNLELSKSKTSTTEGSVLIRVTKDRKSKRIGTGITIPIKSWDKIHQHVKKNHSLAGEYNSVLQEMMKKVVAAYSRILQEADEFSLDDIVAAVNNTPNENFYDFAFRTKMAEIKSTNKIGTYRRYEAVLNKFKDFTGNNLNINRVNYELLKKYEVHLINNLKNSRNTVSSNFSVIRAIINEAIRHDVYKSRNPFSQLQLKYDDKSKEKLTAAELNRLMNNPIPEIYSIQLARDFFMACFLAEGTRGGDMIAMKKEYIINNCLCFSQQKTGSKMVITIVPELMDIFNKYMGTGKYIFPFLNDEKVVNEIIIGNKLAYINKFLKELAKYCGIFKNLSSHVARHSYTDLALEASNGNIYQVQKSLGHSSVKTTEIYSRNRVNYNKKSLLPDILKSILPRKS
jgi:integrase